MNNFENFRRFHNLIADTGLCPVVGSRLFTPTGQSYSHALVIDSAHTLNGRMCYSCKNTDTNDRKVNVGYSDRFDMYPLIEAIIIEFERMN